MTSSEAREELVRLLEAAQRPFPLDRAALLLAVDAYPDLALRSYEGRLDDYAARIASQVGAGESARHRLAALRRFLFEDEALHGNRDDYYDVRNSYLNEVLDRKLGIPISLAVVVVAVAKRLGWPMALVNFPAHVLVRYDAPEEILALDPFHGGLILGEEELQERWRVTTGRAAPPIQQMLRPAEPREALVRIVNNIRAVHHRRREFAGAAAAVEKLALLEPADAHHQRDAGYYHLAAAQPREAVRCLESYLRQAVEPADGGQVRDHLARLYEDLPSAPR